METAIAEPGESALSGARTLARDVGILIQHVSEICRRVHCIEKEAVLKGLVEEMAEERESLLRTESLPEIPRDTRSDEGVEGVR